MTKNNFALTPTEPRQIATMEARESAVATQEVQAALVVAKRFPRDEAAAYDRIMVACQRIGLAEKALYSYPRGGATVEGPSINLAKTIAQKWGNLNYGIRELSQHDGVSEMEAFCWDMETNTRDCRVFHVRHERKAYGNIKKLDDPRDVYEMTANMGARRLRACILGIIPDDVTDAAVEQVNATLRSGGGNKPFEDRVRDMLKMFKALGVVKSMIEKRLNHNIGAISPQELVTLGKIYKSLKDGMSKRRDWFDVQTDLSHLSDKKQSPKKTTNTTKKAGNETPKKPDILAKWQDLCDEYGQVAHNAMEKLGIKTVSTENELSQVTDMCLSLSA